MGMLHFPNAVMSMRLLPAMVAVATLAACAAPQQIAALDDQKCQADGVQAGTKKYDRCRAALESDRKLKNSSANVP
jgi:hypothetical protein